MTPPPLKLTLVDMNNGVPNEATRCFRRLFDAFQHRVRSLNPRVEFTFEHVQPRNLGQQPSFDSDFILSSGGPGAPYDGYEDAWCTGYRKFLDHVVEQNLKDELTAPALFAVCHSFELNVLHFQLCEMERRETLKFGVMPCYVTEEGQAHPLFAPFEDRLFVWEHRSWSANSVDENRLAALGGKVLARESRPGTSNKGEAVLGLHFAPGIQGTQFHPEADRAGVVAWINRPDHAAAVQDAYGESLYEKMLQTLADPTRLARTYALMIPGWLQRRFNQIAESRGLRPIPPPEQDMRAFEDQVQAAV